MRIEEDKPEQATEEEQKEAKPEGEAKPKRRRGFAAMDRAKVVEIAHKGGVAVHAKGTAHRFTSEKARAAGRKGGRAPHRVRGRKLPTPSSPSNAPE
jgi:general stress protein YciG